MNSFIVVLCFIGMASAGNLYGGPALATYAAGPAVVAAPAVYSAPAIVKTHAYAAAPIAPVYSAPVYSAPIVKAAPIAPLAYTAPVYSPAIAKVAAPAVYSAGAYGAYAAPYGAATIL